MNLSPSTAWKGKCVVRFAFLSSFVVVFGCSFVFFHVLFFCLLLFLAFLLTFYLFICSGAHFLVSFFFLSRLPSYSPPAHLPATCLQIFSGSDRHLVLEWTPRGRTYAVRWNIRHIMNCNWLFWNWFISYKNWKHHYLAQQGPFHGLLVVHWVHIQVQKCCHLFLNVRDSLFPEKNAFFWILFKWRGEGPPQVFWHIFKRCILVNKGVYFFQIANNLNLNCFFSLGINTYNI